MFNTTLYIFLILSLHPLEEKTNPMVERVVLFTDRTLYVTGEKILFSAFMPLSDGVNTTVKSNIIYCELITAEGKKISGDKYSVRNNEASGNLGIPEDIITGIYYLRAYTRYMRNYGPEFYHYTRIRIINPYRKEVQAGIVNTSTSPNFHLEERAFRMTDSFEISTDKSAYSSGDTVHLKIDGSFADLSSFRCFILSVVPELSVSASQISQPLINQIASNELYYPETRGPSISGKVLNDSTGTPLPFTTINLSILGNGQDFMARQTDSAGRFFFSLPDYSGYRDLFLCSERVPDVETRILVDNDFCSIPVQFQTEDFKLTQDERETALNMAVNMQLESYFKSSMVSDSLTGKAENQAFYGKPNELLDFDKYILLPHLEDYFNELPSSVQVRKSQGQKYFSVFEDQEGLSVYDPLVLVDQVAIDNPALVLTIQPAEVSRIEVVNCLYVKGDQTYGGIINIISKKGDFAGIDLPSSGIFFNYKLLADTSRYTEKDRGLSNEPDTRNTLFWNPKFSFDKDQIAGETFAVSRTPGSYLIILNAVKLNGEVFRHTFRFQVL